MLENASSLSLFGLKKITRVFLAGLPEIWVTAKKPTLSRRPLVKKLRCGEESQCMERVSVWNMKHSTMDQVI